MIGICDEVKEVEDMKMMKRRWFISLLIVIVIISVASVYINRLLSDEEYLSSDEITMRLEQMYEGTVDQIETKKNLYLAEMTRAGAVYAIEVDAVDGNVLSMKELREVEEIAVEQELPSQEELAPEEEEKIPVTEEVVASGPLEPTGDQAIILREEAIEIALTQLIGEVSSVDFEPTSDGGFYLIEIEKDHEERDDEEAIIQVHAITGEILLVEWDD